MTNNKDNTVEYPRQMNEPSGDSPPCLQSHSKLDIHSFGQRYNEREKRCILLERVDINFTDVKQRQAGTKEKAHSKDTIGQEHTLHGADFNNLLEIAGDEVYFEFHNHLIKEEEEDEEIHIPFDDFLFDINSIGY